jgi:prolyl-tRNA synthetase
MRSSCSMARVYHEPPTDLHLESAPMSAVLVPQEQDFPRWYQDVIAKSQLAENGPVRGTMVIRPWGYAIWERLAAAIDERIKATGARNAYFPLLIPEAFMRREAEHVEGFSPELAVVTHGGGKELEEPVVVRPTSETIVNSSFARWISSYRDLPLLVNQWANVVRWELRPRIFLRSTEFLWQEGHTAHATRDEAHAQALRILDEVYTDAMVQELAIPVFAGRKTEREQFAGADVSWTCEGVMRDGKALQMGTSHELGQNFARAFGIQFSDRDGQLHHVWQTSWGASTRLLGAMIMVHGDDHGLRVPPRLAPTEVVVVVARAGEGVVDAARTIARELEQAGVRTELDDRVEVSLGRRIIDHELRGVPLRVELGPRDLAAGQVVVARRARADKETLELGALTTIPQMLVDDQRELLAQAAALRDARTRPAHSLDEARELAADGFARLPWRDVNTEGEARLAQAGVSVRCLVRGDGEPVDDPDADGVDALVARAY